MRIPIALCGLRVDYHSLLFFAHEPPARNVVELLKSPDDGHATEPEQLISPKEGLTTEQSTSPKDGHAIH